MTTELVITLTPKHALLSCCRRSALPPACTGPADGPAAPFVSPLLPPPPSQQRSWRRRRPTSNATAPGRRCRCGSWSPGTWWLSRVETSSPPTARSVQLARWFALLGRFPLIGRAAVQCSGGEARARPASSIAPSLLGMPVCAPSASQLVGHGEPLKIDESSLTGEGDQEHWSACRRPWPAGLPCCGGPCSERL